MLLRLFLLFTLVPLVELALLIRIGGLIGLGPTLGVVLVTGAAGAWLARREGLRSWLAVQGEMAAGRVPGEELVHGMIILFAGALLVTPGVLTDAVGFSLLLRPLRRRLIARLRERFTRQLETGTAGAMGMPGVRIFWSSSSGWGHPERREEPSAGRPHGREIVVDDAGDEESDPALGSGRP